MPVAGFAEETGTQPLVISARERAGLDSLVEALFRCCHPSLFEA